jgi:hypothetical protein
LLFRASLPTLLLVASCLLPTDESRSVFVTMEQGSGVIGRGGTLVLRAQAWTTASDGSVRSLDGATFTWRSSAPAIATVVPGVGGRATVTGVRSGSVRIFAIPDQFNDPGLGEADIRVANTVEIDSVRPETVRFGQELTLYGVGIGKIDRVFLGDAPLIPDSATFTGDSAGVGSMSFWVRAPASTQRVLAAVTEGFSASSPDTVVVIPEDFYETGDTVPVPVSLDGAPIRAPNVLFYNPALSIEGVATGADTVPAQDNFRFFRTRASGPLTVVIRAAVLPLGQFDAVIRPYPTISLFSGWGIGVQSQRCGGAIFSGSTIVTGTRTDSVIRVVDPTTASSFRTDIRGDRGNYSIEIRDGEPTADPSMPADRFEYNDHCEAADSNYADPGRLIDVTIQPFREDLTIHRPYDIDWYKFNITPDSAGLISVSVKSLPAHAADPSDIDLYVVRPFGLITLSATAGSSSETTQFVSEPFGGPYYVLVIDQAGAPTRYSLCISFGTACAAGSAAVGGGAAR